MGSHIACHDKTAVRPSTPPIAISLVSAGALGYEVLLILCLLKTPKGLKVSGHIRKEVMVMNRAEFEADLQHEGYELREGEIKPNEHRESHAHGFDARLFVLEGSITLVFGDDRNTYSPGDSCSVPAGTMHEEHTEAHGVRYLVGRRSATHAPAAE